MVGYLYTVVLFHNLLVNASVIAVVECVDGHKCQVASNVFLLSSATVTIDFCVCAVSQFSIRLLNYMYRPTICSVASKIATTYLYISSHMK